MGDDVPYNINISVNGGNVMRLNAHILMDELGNKYPVTYYGPQVTQLHLKRPEIYNVFRNDVPFSKNRTYCITTDSLPAEPVCEPGTLLVCIGGNIPECYRQGEIGCIWLQDDPQKIIEVFNTVQWIFDKYDDWEYQLQNILYSNASIQEMVDCCEEILPNPIIVIDASLRFLGRSRNVDTDSSLAMYRPGKDGKVQLKNLKEYLSFRDMYTKAGPLFYDNNRVYIWDVWLHSRYLGNVTIPYIYYAQRKSDRWILSILEQYIANALTRYINNPELRANVLRSSFQDLLEDKPLGEESLRILDGFAGQYLCVRMKFQIYTEHSQPISFYCSYIENTLPHSVCVEYSSSIVVFADISELDWEKTFLPALRHIVDEMNLHVGISNPFCNLSQAKYYYQQANYALKRGSPSPNSNSVYFFQDYILTYLLTNATGGMPLESLYSDGITRLLEHDASSKVSFAETLLIYLRNSMNITKTALDLKIHRSSFLERLHNIESLLGSNLDEPQERLYLQIILERLLSH